nr:MAG TPA: hypothetical protein [Caudoviricetes sp.]
MHCRSWFLSFQGRKKLVDISIKALQYYKHTWKEGVISE